MAGSAGETGCRLEECSCCSAGLGPGVRLGRALPGRRLGKHGAAARRGRWGRALTAKHDELVVAHHGGVPAARGRLGVRLARRLERAPRQRGQVENVQVSEGAAVAVLAAEDVQALAHQGGLAAGVGGSNG
jgi:hypothetical protein